MKKILALIALFAFASSSAFASVQVSQDGTNKGQFRKVNLTDGMTIDNDGDVELGTITPASVAATGAVSGTIVTSTYYAVLPYYSKLTMIGSGAPAGAKLVRGGDAAKNCGIGGDGTTIYECVSNGTNWVAV